MSVMTDVTDAEKVDATCALLAVLESGLRSSRFTVQVMPDGVEVIHVESGDLVQKLMLSEVPCPATDEAER